jgi:hypothetical protein
VGHSERADGLLNLELAPEQWERAVIGRAVTRAVDEVRDSRPGRGVGDVAAVTDLPSSPARCAVPVANTASTPAAAASMVLGSSKSPGTILAPSACSRRAGSDVGSRVVARTRWPRSSRRSTIAPSRPVPPVTSTVFGCGVTPMHPTRGTKVDTHGGYQEGEPDKSIAASARARDRDEPAQSARLGEPRRIGMTGAEQQRDLALDVVRDADDLRPAVIEQQIRRPWIAVEG